ncbi:MAG: 4'-phosphopantetheinyl transferase superfamily protein [Oscillospiraceae bacterium]|nr:4'-phosphopantetheinyl transferase superfamily protein [Candidatus Ruminococcus equi]
MVKIYIADVSKLNDEKTFSDLLSTVSKARQEKVNKLRFQKDKSLSLGAGVLLNLALKDMGCKFSDNDIVFSQNGKPYIENCKVKFNLSHSGTKVMCAVSEDDIGCDVEKVKDIDDKIAKRFFHNEEYDYILSQKSEEKQKDAFFRLWTLKESFLKITGLGMKLPLSDFSIIINDKDISIRQNLDKNDYRFFEIDLSDEYKYSVCFIGNNEVETKIVEL